MEIRVRARVESYSVWIGPDELASPREAAKQFEQLVQEATRYIARGNSAGALSTITLPTSSGRPQLPAPGPTRMHGRPLVQCPHCEDQALKGAGLAAHIKREHAGPQAFGARA